MNGTKYMAHVIRRVEYLLFHTGQDGSHSNTCIVIIRNDTEFDVSCTHRLKIVGYYGVLVVVGFKYTIRRNIITVVCIASTITYGTIGKTFAITTTITSHCKPTQTVLAVVPTMAVQN